MIQTEGKTRLWTASASILALCLLSAPVLAQVTGRSASGRCRVEGTVEDADGNPLAGVEVLFHNQETKTKSTKVKTKKNGKFVHPLVERGPYKIEFVKDDLKVYFLSMDNKSSGGEDRGSFDSAYFSMAEARLDNVHSFAASGIAQFVVKMTTPANYEELAMKAAQGAMPDVGEVAETVQSRRHPAEEARELFELKNYEGALVKFEEAEALEGGAQDADVAFAMAQTYFYLDRYDESEAKLKQVIVLDGGETRVGVNYFLALISDKKGEKEQAVQYMEQEIATIPDPPSTMLATMGGLYRDVGENQKAIDSLEQAIAKDPGNLGALLNLGSLYNSIGNKDQAEHYFELAAKAGASQGKKGAAIFFNIGALAVNDGDLQKAVDAFERAISLNPNYAAAHRELGYTYRDLKQNEKALEHFSAYLKLQPKAPEKEELETWIKYNG